MQTKRIGGALGLVVRADWEISRPQAEEALEHIETVRWFAAGQHDEINGGCAIRQYNGWPTLTLPSGFTFGASKARALLAVEDDLPAFIEAATKAKAINDKALKDCIEGARAKKEAKEAARLARVEAGAARREAHAAIRAQQNEKREQMLAKPAPKLARWAITEAQRTLRSELSKAAMFLDEAFCKAVSESFNNYAARRGKTAWRKQDAAWYRELKDQVRAIKLTTGISDDINPDVDMLCSQAETVARYLRSQEWRARWLDRLGLLEAIQATWAATVTALDDAIQVAEAELAQQRTVPASALPLPMLEDAERRQTMREAVPA